MIVVCVISPKNKLGTFTIWNLSILATEFKVTNEIDLYATIDYLLKRQNKIEDNLVKHLLHPDDLAYYNLSLSYV
ncbi:MAG: hypothetical protein AMR96_03085 [Candidatus Adiutrix intracellularis]|nr:MAG: hypothetical protein AMR96_03085 [Candidatus Adiutrix intracellularis]